MQKYKKSDMPFINHIYPKYSDREAGANSPPKSDATES